MEESKSVFEMTNFYYPGWGRNIRLQSEHSSSSSPDEEDSAADEEKKDNIGMSGFAGSQAGDIPYETIFEYFGFSIEPEDAKDKAYCQNIPEIAWDVMKNSGPMFRVRKESIPVDLKADIVVNWVYKHRNVDFEAASSGLSAQQVKNIIYEFKTIRHYGKDARKRLNLMRRKLHIQHILSIQNFVENHLDQGFTLVDCKKHLLANFPDLSDISLSSINQLLKKQLKLRYKKLGLNNPIKARPESKSNLLSCIKLINSLIEERFHAVFLDEFLVNRNTLKSYGWARKGQPGRRTIKSTGFRMSFIVAHSQTRIEGIVGTSTTFNQIKYAHFLKMFVSKLKNDPEVHNERLVIVADNWRFHRAKRIQKFFKKEGLIWLFIPPYSPEANACEKLINCVKCHIKNCVNQQRWVLAS